MTANELRNKLNIEYGIDKLWPKTLEVDYETYANVVVDLIRWSIEHGREIELHSGTLEIPISVSENQNLYFKGIELILVK